MWELFGEVWAPSPNDLANTTLGGITLGEMLFRFSSLTLKNEATGGNRVRARGGRRPDQPGPGIQPPGSGRDRPDLRDPAGLASAPDPGLHGRRLPALLDLVGARRSRRPLDQTFVQFCVFYGDQLGGSGQEAVLRLSGLRHPGEPIGNHKPLQELRVRGNLAAKPLGSESRASCSPVHDLRVPQQPGGGLWRAGLPGRDHGPSRSLGKTMRLYGEAMARANPIAADPLGLLRHRRGPGLRLRHRVGRRLEGRAAVAGQGHGSCRGGFVWLPVVSGFPGRPPPLDPQHRGPRVLSAASTGRCHATTGCGATAVTRSTRMWTRTCRRFRVFLSLAIPRWEEQ